MKKIIIAGIATLLLTGTAWYLIKHDIINLPTNKSAENSKTQTDPRKVTMDFYNQWLAAERSTTTDPYASNLLSQGVISPDLRSQIEQKHTAMKPSDQDPVMCQTKNPKSLTAKEVYATTTDAQILIYFRTVSERLPNQALATLHLVDGSWQIQKIECSGEVAPISEFNFEQTGSLLKESAVAPLDPKNIYLVYKDGDQPESTVRLIFNASSLCIAKDGSKKVCVTGQLAENTKALIQANMTEEGAVVKKLTLQ